eukprot:Plantae.Rhodophyta-Purpureofilum_apyrenoidigerum.ctg23473.p1 GENE.Plantae.Rhodophyta-Purpureofilum_apyrenoidigerum.ctg23473~~Plantae.Rhodophyta-Purpureofilum_apyrenoidigerum.ctg23473.p1  ORF type:complete len:274 (-),score=48.89 Plantae.Rhodophyta-Purpureofilum_apyrenoidigerum.ctg23473:605-1426(-)
MTGFVGGTGTRWTERGARKCQSCSRVRERTAWRASVSGNGTDARKGVDVKKITEKGTAGASKDWVTVRARHILLETEEMADACLQQIESNNATFEELAKSLSQCPSNARGGDLGWFGRNMMVPPFEMMCFEAEIGSLNKLKTAFGWHVIRVDGKGTVPTDISVDEFVQRYNDSSTRETLQLIDVRERKELDVFKLDGFTHLPVSEHANLAKEIEDDTLGLDAEMETIVVCQSGARSAHIAKFLAQQGFWRVRNLVGGLDRYIREEGLDVPKGR